MKNKLLIILVFVLLIMIVKFVFNHLNSANWLQTNAQIIKTDIEKNYRKSNGSYTFKPIIHYHYKVNDKKYTGTKISFIGKKYRRRNDAQDVIDEIAINGKNIRIYYNPENPKQSVIIK